MPPPKSGLPARRQPKAPPVQQLFLAVYQGRCFRQPVEQAADQIERRGQRLRVAHLIAVNDADVRKRAAVVNVDQPGV
jgi:hypothetical protein